MVDSILTCAREGFQLTVIQSISSFIGRNNQKQEVRVQLTAVSTAQLNQVVLTQKP